VTQAGVNEIRAAIILRCIILILDACWGADRVDAPA